MMGSVSPIRTEAWATRLSGCGPRARPGAARRGRRRILLDLRPLGRADHDIGPNGQPGPCVEGPALLDFFRQRSRRKHRLGPAGSCASRFAAWTRCRRARPRRRACPARFPAGTDLRSFPGHCRKDHEIQPHLACAQTDGPQLVLGVAQMPGIFVSFGRRERQPVVRFPQ